MVEQLQSFQMPFFSAVVCQQFILDRVTNVGPVLSDQNIEQQRFQAADQFIREESFGERTRLIGNKRYTSTWC